jgi:DNA-binding LacI/PurR family transcriptional regulator
MKEHGGFPGFDGWQEGYGAFTHSLADRDRLIGYIKGQQTHHAATSFREELRALLREAGVEYDEAYFV